MLFTRFLALAAAFLSVEAGYNDGYETINGPLQPFQIRVAYNGPRGMTVSWNSFHRLVHPWVRYGTNPNNLNQYAKSTVSVTYPTSLTYNNHVMLTDLKPDTLYYYKPSNSNATTPYNFRTARSAGDLTPYTMGVVVDMGTFGSLGLSDHVGNGAANPLTPGEQTTIQGIKRQINDIAFMAHPGDIAYADYWLKEEIQGYLPNTTIANGSKVYEHILNAFFDELEPISRHKPYMVSPGNHDANCDNGGTKDKANNITYTESICMVGQTNFTGYRNHWRMPSGPSGGVENFWYSYDYGMTHFVSIDTETDLGNGLVGPDEGSPEYSGPFGAPNQQIDWLKNDLAKVDRTKTPWVIVFGHRPFYSSTSSNCANCMTAFEPLFHQYGVDMYMSGHAHVYERMDPIYNGTIDPRGLNNPTSTLYLLNGAAGHYDGLDTLVTPLQNYSAYAQDTAYSWTKLLFQNCTHMTLQAIASENSTVYDTATLIKHRSCRPTKRGLWESMTSLVF